MDKKKSNQTEIKMSKLQDKMTTKKSRTRLTISPEIKS
jgi:hypothetical protein